MTFVEPNSRAARGAGRSYVRVLRRRPDGFVEFIFSLDDPDLGVDLILPVSAFEQFCTEHQVHLMSPQEAAHSEAQALKWRFGQAGISE